MRHFLANIITYAIAVLLFAGAAAFAWMRAAQLTISTESAVLAGYRTAPTPTLVTGDTGPAVAAAGAVPFRWQEPGARSYARNCRNCHGRDGQGWDQYPPVAQALPRLAAGGGRAHLIDVLLHGLDTDRWGAPMPRMGHMQDVEIAAVLNYTAAELLATPLVPPITASEVAARRNR